MNNEANARSAYQWKYHDTVDSDTVDRYPELPRVAVQMLANRDITEQEDVDRFLNPDYGQDQHDPFLFNDMRTAVDRINTALEKKEKIAIHGDYDADGVCASSVLYKTLQKLGADVEVYIPHRDTEGYGVNMNTVQKLHDAGVKLIITVDCGISNAPEVAKAVEMGMEVIVTDHHSQPPELPTAALAIINPKLEAEQYPFNYLAGVGVAFKLSQALIREHDLGEAFEKWLLDLVAIATVTDFVELVGENRVFLKYGLVVLRKNMRPGLRQMFATLGEDASNATAQTIGFKLGPRINAAGRMDHANMAYALMIEEDESVAAHMAANIEKTNRDRQKISTTCADQAMAQASEQTGEYILIVRLEHCPVGLVGLVAGKLSSEFARPTFVVTEHEGTLMGSGRSIEQFHLVEALQAKPEFYEKYGGHPMACGFTLKSKDVWDDFVAFMRERARGLLEGQDLRKSLYIEQELTLGDANWELVDLLEQFAPFGQSNPEPVFASKRVTVQEVKAVGKRHDHLKLTVEQNGTQRPCIGFGLGAWADQLLEGEQIDIAYTVGVNEWNGNREIQLMINDIIK